MGHLLPNEIIKKTEETAAKKIKIELRRTFILALLAGAYISIGATLSILVGYGFPSASEGNPAMQKVLSAAVFPLGLILIYFAGAELFTGNNAVLIPAFLNKKFKLKDVVKNWGTVYLGNFIGICFFTYFMVYLTKTLHYEPWQDAVVSIAEYKVSNPWHIVFFKGIAANWMVCLAIWLAFCSKNTTGKVVGIWFPIFGFVTLGYDHCIANMYYGMMGIMEGADITFLELFTKNLVPSTLGNIIGGAFFVGTIYWYTYGKE